MLKGGVPIKEVIVAVSRKSGKKFILDPRVHAEVVLVGQDTGTLGFNELLAVLRDYGFAAVEYGGFVHILPDALIRAVPVPVISGKDTRPDAEFVSKVITVKNVSAAQLVPVLRPRYLKPHIWPPSPASTGCSLSTCSPMCVALSKSSIRST